jgi:NAD(P)H-hydrate epimerase
MKHNLNMYLSVAAIRQVDLIAVSTYGMDSLVLMENAGVSCCDSIGRFLNSNETVTQEIVPKSRVKFDHSNHGISKAPDSGRKRAVVLCGAGNNGGDGLVIARHLELRGWEVVVWMLNGVENLSSDCSANYRIAQTAGITIRILEDFSRDAGELIHDIEAAALLIDAMLGTGARGNPRYPLGEVIQAANQSKAVRVAVDVPTGLDAESGTAGEPTFKADLTCTFVAQKTGFQSPVAREYLGQVDVCSIGVPKRLLEEVFDAGELR